mgnify:CR=1 FL=1
MKKNRNKIKGSSNNTILPIIRDRVNINKDKDKDKDKGRKEIYRKVKMEDKVNNRAKKTNK